MIAPGGQKAYLDGSMCNISLSTSLETYVDTFPRYLSKAFNHFLYKHKSAGYHQNQDGANFASPGN